MRSDTEFQAIVLAAGLGTRMRPLTNHIPKPLIPFGPDRPLDIAIRRLNKAGVGSIAVNAHHRAEDIIAHLSDRWPSATTSVEFPCILGTAGLFGPLRNWLLANDVILYNSDIITDACLLELMRRHREPPGAIATMMLLEKPDPSKTPVFVNSRGCVVGIGQIDHPGSSGSDDYSSYSFTGIHAVRRDILSHIPVKGPSEIIPIYQHLIRQGLEIRACFHSGTWFDLGDPRSYWDAFSAVYLRQGDLALRLKALSIEGLTTGTQSLLVRDSEMISIGEQHLRRCWIDDVKGLPSSITIENSVVFADAALKAGVKVRGKICGFGAQLSVPA